MTILFLCLAVIVVARLLRASRVPIRHRGRRRQARIICEALHGRDRSKPPALIYARVWTMDALAFEELPLDSFGRRKHRVICNRHYTGDRGIDGKVMIDGFAVLVPARRYGTASRPEHVLAFALLCAGRGVSRLFAHTGRIGGAPRDLVARRGAVEIVSGQRLMALIIGAPLFIKGEPL